MFVNRMHPYIHTKKYQLSHGSVHQLKTQWTWIWQYICLRHTYQHLDDFRFFPTLFSPRNDGSVIAEVSNQCDASLLWREIQSFIKGSYKVMDRGSGDQGLEWKLGLLPPCYPKHEPKEPKGLRCFSSKIKLKVVLRWFGYLKVGVVISVLRWAMRFVIQKVECGSTPNTDAGPCLLHPPTQMRFILSVPYQDTEEGHLSLPMYAEVAKKASPGFEDHRPQLLGRG